MNAPLRAHRQQLNPIPAGPRSANDARAFGQPYSPALQPDQAKFATLLYELAQRGVVSLEQIIDAATANNIPPLLTQASFLAMITVDGAPGAQLLIPKASRRMGFTIANFLGASGICFSYDKPLNLGNVTGSGLSVNLGAGIPLGGCFEETNGAVTENDIWVFCNDTTQLTVTPSIPILGYEGRLSITGNRP